MRREILKSDFRQANIILIAVLAKIDNRRSKALVIRCNDVVLVRGRQEESSDEQKTVSMRVQMGLLQKWRKRVSMSQGSERT